MDKLLGAEVLMHAEFIRNIDGRSPARRCRS
jgi:hypothetical protein